MAWPSYNSLQHCTFIFSSIYNTGAYRVITSLFWYYGHQKIAQEHPYGGTIIKTPWHEWQYRCCFIWGEARLLSRGNATVITVNSFCLVTKEILLKYDNTVRQIFTVQELRLNKHQIFRSHLSKDSQDPYLQDIPATTKPPGFPSRYHVQNYANQPESEDKISSRSRMEENLSE